MRIYWKNQPRRNPAVAGKSTSASPAPFDDASVLSEFDRVRLSLIAKEDGEGWPAELRRYLKEMPDDVTKDTDIVEWWQVSFHCQDRVILH
jgi:hypothetical protein